MSSTNLLTFSESLNNPPTSSLTQPNHGLNM